MKKLTVVLAIILLLGGCAGTKLVSDYDEVIDKGITEFAEQLNTHVKNMGDLAGKPDGTYEANLKTYNALDSKLDVMIARASSASEGKGCKLEKKVSERVKHLFGDEIPAEIRASDTNSNGDSYGCNERLLVLVKNQLSSIEEIHRETDKCGENGDISCLRPSTINSVLSIANQSINAVSIVEISKKQ